MISSQRKSIAFAERDHESDSAPFFFPVYPVILPILLAYSIIRDHSGGQQGSICIFSLGAENYDFSRGFAML